MIVVYVTYPDADEAQKISRIVVEGRLAACANIFPAHQSLYWWDGAVQNAREVAVIYKTKQSLFEALKAEIIKHHSYDCPCVVAWSIGHGHAPFLDWISQQTG